MAEAIPLFQTICLTIIEKVGADRPAEVIATTMVAIALSSIFTGIVYYVMGKFKMV